MCLERAHFSLALRKGLHCRMLGQSWHDPIEAWPPNPAVNVEVIKLSLTFLKRLDARRATYGA